MIDHDDSTDRPDPAGSFWKTRTGAVLLAFLAVAGLLLVLEHRAHLFAGDGLLVLLLAACIGMHFFMHGSHGGRGGGGRGDGGSNRGDQH